VGAAEDRLDRLEVVRLGFECEQTIVIAWRYSALSLRKTSR